MASWSATPAAPRPAPADSPAATDHSAAKAGLANTAKAQSKEVGPRGIRASTVSPGPAATDRWPGAGGGYTRTVESKTFLAKRGGGNGFLEAELSGARMVTSQEPPGGARYDDGLVKTVTGRDRQRTTVYQDGFTGALFLDKPHEVERSADAFEQIWAAAASEAASSRLIRQSAKDLSGR